MFNRKGGTYKTSITANVGYTYAYSGSDVLLIDADPQGNLALELGYRDRSDKGEGLARSMLHGSPIPAPMTVRDASDGLQGRLDVVPGGPALDSLIEPATELTAQTASRMLVPGAYDNLAGLEDLVDDYDLIIIDNGPALSALSNAALGVAHHLIIPSGADTAGPDGATLVARYLDRIGEYNPYLDVLGVVMVGLGVRATRMRRESMADLVAAFGAETIFQTTIRTATKAAWLARRQGKVAAELASDADQATPVWKLLKQGLKIPQTADSAPGLLADYVRLTAEITERISAAEQQDQDAES